MASLRAVNLNLLPVLRELLRCRNVTHAAERLHMSQSATSDALARLRAQFDDALLERVGREMRPTALGRALLPELEAVLAGAERLVGPVAFDPAKLERRFLIATADAVSFTITPPLMQALQIEAPGVLVQFVDLADDTRRLLDRQDLDLIIVPDGVGPTHGLQSLAIYDEDFVCIARQGHPEIGSRLTARQYAALPHVAYRADQFTDNSVEARLVGRAQRDLVRVPNFTLLPHLVEHSDTVAFVQRRIAEHFAARAPLRILKPPFEVPLIEMCAYWTAAHDGDPAHRWLRTVLANLDL